MKAKHLSIEPVKQSAPNTGQLMKFLQVFAIALALFSSTAIGGDAKLAFPEDLIPRFNIPKMTASPTIDGKIDAQEWQNAMRASGVVSAHTLQFKDRPISFWVAWDDDHLYIASRSDVLPGHRLYKTRREQYSTSVVYDDAYEFGIFLHDRNQLAGEVSSFLKIVLNAVGAGDYMKIYPEIGQNMYNWKPEPLIANRVYESEGKQWWEMEMALSLKDLQMPVKNKAGDKMDILLAADLKNPEWQWLDFPSATGHLLPYGFPKATLTSEKPYVQVERIAGLHDEKIDFMATIYNPGPKAAEVNAKLSVIYNPPEKPKQPASTVISKEKKILIPPGGSKAFLVDETFPGLKYDVSILDDGSTQSVKVHNFCNLRFEVSMDDEPKDSPIYFYACDFGGTDKSYLNAVPRVVDFDASATLNPSTNKVEISGDTLDAKIPKGGKPVALRYSIKKDGDEVSSGIISQHKYDIFSDIIDLPNLAPGKYAVELALLDKDGKPLISRNDLSIVKKDEPKEFAKWWDNKIARTDRILPPFEALKIEGNRVSCTRRSYDLDGLGLPHQIVSNGGDVLSRPARIVVTVGGKEYVVPTDGKLVFTERKDWRIEFTGQSSIAGLQFTAEGSMEQDGLVNLSVTYAPVGEAVAIDDLRVEWPIDDSQGNWMQCIGGTGGNYSPRTIGKVPEGQGLVWDTLSAIGKTGSEMALGNWHNNLWVGNYDRGLCWFGDNDQGWVPNDETPAHSLVRDGNTLIMINHLIGLPSGQGSFLLKTPRSVNLQYNATPFRHLAEGWRHTQVSACTAFSSPEFKANEKSKKEYFSILSMPSTDVNEWPYYLEKYKAKSDEIAQQRGKFSIYPRLGLFLANQIALRGYMDKTLEPGVYEYFGPDWMAPKKGESLNKTYRDYMIYLMDLQVRKGGCTHFYFDISFTCSTDALLSGFGYRLPDGRIQPGSMDSTLREWYKRAWALMAENDLYPGGISGHATHSIPLRALPWTDAILDSEYPMKDPIAVYTKDKMIAMSCPHNFGVNICHLGQMNQDWAALHDAGSGRHDGRFWTQEFRHFGISAQDVEYLPYWRNQSVVRVDDPGVLASVWKRPGQLVIQTVNYGIENDAKETIRSASMTLDLAALGLPPGTKQEQIRVQEMRLDGGKILGRYAGGFEWYRGLPACPDSDEKAPSKIRPKASPTIDVTTGRMEGADVFYHDSRYFLLTWDDKEPSPQMGGFNSADLVKALNWGLNRKGTEYLSSGEANNLVQTDDNNIKLAAWKRTGSVMIRLTNVGSSVKKSKLTLNLKALGIDVPKLWRSFTQAVGANSYDANSGELSVDVPPGESQVVFVDTY